MAIKVFAFLVCYIPATFHSAWGHQRSHVRHDRWPGFLAQFCIFISSGINPIINSFRTRRFRSALKQLLKDPCGRSPFQGSKEGEMGPWGIRIPFKITRKVGVSNKIIHESEEPNITDGGFVENVNGECHVRTCKETRSNEKKGHSRRYESDVRLAWWIAKTLRGLQDPMAKAHNRVAITQSKKSMWKCIHIAVIVFRKNGSDKQGQHPLEEYNT